MKDLLAEGVRPAEVHVRYPGPDGQPMFVPPRYPLADGIVRFVGEPVVAVLADTRNAARDAAELCVARNFGWHERATSVGIDSPSVAAVEVARSARQLLLLDDVGKQRDGPL